jgi:hypothetical protein
MERRRMLRFTKRAATAELIVGRHVIQAAIADLSLGGARLVGDALPTMGAWISMLIITPEREFMAAGHVVWHDATGMVGVQFAPGSALHRQELAALIEADGRRGGLAAQDQRESRTARTRCADESFGMAWVCRT